MFACTFEVVLQLFQTIFQFIVQIDLFLNRTEFLLVVCLCSFPSFQDFCVFAVIALERRHRMIRCVLVSSMEIYHLNRFQLSFQCFVFYCLKTDLLLKISIGHELLIVPWLKKISSRIWLKGIHSITSSSSLLVVNARIRCSNSCCFLSSSFLIRSFSCWTVSSEFNFCVDRVAFRALMSYSIFDHD